MRYHWLCGEQTRAQSAREARAKRAREEESYKKQLPFFFFSSHFPLLSFVFPLSFFCYLLVLFLLFTRSFFIRCNIIIASFLYGRHTPG